MYDKNNKSKKAQLLTFLLLATLVGLLLSNLNRNQVISDNCEVKQQFWFPVSFSPSPTWVQPPQNQTVEFGSSFVYDLNATDPAGLDQWWINNITHFTINGEGIIRNATRLSVYVYKLQVWVNNTIGEILTANFNVTVQDTTLPSWIVIPTNVSIDYGEKVDYQLEAWDLSGISRWEVLIGAYHVVKTPWFILSDSTGLQNDTIGPSEHHMKVIIYNSAILWIRNLTSTTWGFSEQWGFEGYVLIGFYISVNDSYNNTRFKYSQVYSAGPPNTTEPPTTPPDTPTPPPGIPGFPGAAVIIGVVSALSVGIVLRHRYRRKR